MKEKFYFLRKLHVTYILETENSFFSQLCDKRYNLITERLLQQYNQNRTLSLSNIALSCHLQLILDKDPWTNKIVIGCFSRPVVNKEDQKKRKERKDKKEKDKKEEKEKRIG